MNPVLLHGVLNSSMSGLWGKIFNDLPQSEYAGIAEVFPLAFSVIPGHMPQTSSLGYAPGLRSRVGSHVDDGYFGGGKVGGYDDTAVSWRYLRS